ncbi:hypothetical protein BJX76DRAFT_22425 [Aspergillus varians]
MVVRTTIVILLTIATPRVPVIHCVGGVYPITTASLVTVLSIIRLLRFIFIQHFLTFICHDFDIIIACFVPSSFRPSSTLPTNCLRADVGTVIYTRKPSISPGDDSDFLLTAAKF